MIDLIQRILRHRLIDGKRFSLGALVGILVALLRFFGIVDVELSEDQIADVAAKGEALVELSKETWTLLVSLYGVIMAWFVRDTKALRDTVLVDFRDE